VQSFVTAMRSIGSRIGQDNWRSGLRAEGLQ
jgi:hypothetical protein